MTVPCGFSNRSQEAVAVVPTPFPSTNKRLRTHSAQASHKQTLNFVSFFSGTSLTTIKFLPAVLDNGSTA